MLWLTLALSTALAGAPIQANDRCPVTGRDVTNHRLYHHVTLQGRTYYVFDHAAAVRLKECPSCFLAKDGTPLNAGPR